jgi:hypothetical protein
VRAELQAKSVDAEVQTQYACPGKPTRASVASKTTLGPHFVKIIAFGAKIRNLKLEKLIHKWKIR